MYPGRSATGSVLSIALERLNGLIESWEADGMSAYSVTRTQFTLTANVGSYTVGTGGDIAIARPVKIDGIGLIPTIPATGNPEFQLQGPLHPSEYQYDPDKDIISMPARFYYNATYPLGTLHLMPRPASAYTIFVYHWHILQATDYSSGSDTIAFPTGYPRALMYYLAMELEPLLRKYGAQLTDNIVVTARQLKAQLEVLNRKPVVMLSDLPQFDSGSWSWGWNGGGGGSGVVEVYIAVNGTIDGTNGSDGNAVFTLATSQTLSIIKLYKNGTLQTPNTSYTRVGTTITFTAGNVPIVGDVLVATGE